jgi:pimeloyl-ACP methyl ester carboxylesterase
MKLVVQGDGPPVLVVPGIQGRWEWHRPGIDALARRCRVITFSYADEPTAGAAFDPGAPIDSYCDQIGDAIRQAGYRTVALCGISYGGLLAAVFTARHPEMVSSLILASALPPTWTPDARVMFYVRAPRLLMPVFVLGSIRLFEEILAASATFSHAIRLAAAHSWNALRHMLSPTRMARRARVLATVHLTEEISHIRVPTLVLVGETHLDRVVPVAATLEYARLVPGCRVVTLDHTGHLGCVTRPEKFAELIASFAAEPHMETRNARG